MVRRVRRVVSVVLVSMIVAWACASHAPSVHVSGNAEALALERVVVFQNGIAHFERRGRVEEGAIELSVKSEVADDVLRSLTVSDGRGAAIRSVRLLPSSPRADVVTLRIELTGTGARELRVSYVTELPGWKPTYRVVVRGNDRVDLQGLAVVDNRTPEDWRGIRLALSTELPLSFRYDLREPRMAHRPRFGSDGRLRREPTSENEAPRREHEIRVDANGRVLNFGEINEAYGRAQRDQPEGSTRAGEMVGNNAAAPAATGAAPVTAPATDDARDPLLEFEARSTPTAGSVLPSVRGLNLGAGESGMVPFTDAQTSGQLVLMYKPAPGGPLSAQHPYRAALFRNPLDAPLLNGPVSIYAGDRFVGDAVTGAIPARAHAFVAYALERSVRVEAAHEREDDEVRGIQLTGGVLTVELRAVERHRFVLRSARPWREKPYLFVAQMAGFEPRELPRGTIAAAGGWFVPAPSGRADAEVGFDLVQRRTQTLNVAAEPRHPWVAALLTYLRDHEDVPRLREIVDRLARIADERRHLEEDLVVRRESVEQRRATLDTIRHLPLTHALRQRLIQALAQSVAEVDDLTRRNAELHAEEVTLEEEWYVKLRELRFEPPASP